MTNLDHEDFLAFLRLLALTAIVLFLIGGGMWGCWSGYKAIDRQQRIWDAQNEVTINNIRIQQQAQLIQVEKQKAEIRVVEANGISRAQHIINATLTDRYLQHEAIKAQEHMAGSPNHTTIYIPSGQNGIPIVKTLDDRNPATESKK